MKNESIKGNSVLSRRDFIKTSAALGAASLAVGTNRMYAAGSDKVRIGLIGCGGRGTHDATKCLRSSENVELVAMGDLFKDRLDRCRRTLRRDLSEKVKVTEDKCFVGWDAHKKVVACDDVDMVILTEPPHFRPSHLKAAIEAGKHVFMEKPAAVDPVGVRSVIASSELADRKGLTIVAGTQMRRISHLVEGIKAIHDGAIGELVGGQCVRLGGGMLTWGQKERQPEWSDMEWHLRRWLFLTWLSGDFIVEMHVHNLDVMNWAFGGPPVQCVGMGGREVRKGPEYGNVFDHFAVEYEYPNGVRVEYMGYQIDCPIDRSDQRFVGTKGKAYSDFGRVVVEGRNKTEFAWDQKDPCITQHADQIAAIRQGKRLNEGRRVAESSLTSIMGRMSAYTGRALKFDWAMNASKLDLSPPAYEFGDLEMRPVAVPGKTRLI
ncbi:MAG: Gfo/Idh/MocA family oxidoreductase [Planctomycetes bacterium]|nr:Gfo/Idh/MocA family oxidoreductase [Planctomycetota bacterium]MBL7143994.1 Gfo/Idh/MocA family oxidoreductase [Phycisphaerae bacterium]